MSNMGWFSIRWLILKCILFELIGKPMRIDLKKFMRDRCDFCLHVIPEDEEGIIIFAFTSYRDDDNINIGQACPECGKFFIMNDREKLIWIFKDSLRREFPIMPSRGIFEEKSVERMNQILDSIEDYDQIKKEVNPFNL